MIDCESCILKNARMSDLKCDVSCLDLEDALREHDKRIRAEAIKEIQELMKQYVNYENVDIFIEALGQLEKQNKSKNLKF